LVQRGKEAGLRLDFPLLLFLQAIHNCIFRFPVRPIRLLPELSFELHAPSSLECAGSVRGGRAPRTRSGD
jgi:hypothetical protein